MPSPHANTNDKTIAQANSNVHASTTRRAASTTLGDPPHNPRSQYPTSSEGLSITRSIEDGTLESLMARASMTNPDEPILDQTVHARQAITPGLSFRDTRLEQLYQMDYFVKYIKMMQRAIMIGTFLWLLFVINDGLKESEGKRRNFPATIGLRFGVIALALCALACTYSARFGRRSITWLIVIVIILFGSAQVVSGVIERDTTDPTYSYVVSRRARLAPARTHSSHSPHPPHPSSFFARVCSASPSS